MGRRMEAVEDAIFDKLDPMLDKLEPVMDKIGDKLEPAMDFTIDKMDAAVDKLGGGLWAEVGVVSAACVALVGIVGGGIFGTAVFVGSQQAEIQTTVQMPMPGGNYNIQTIQIGVRESDNHVAKNVSAAVQYYSETIKGVDYYDDYRLVSVQGNCSLKDNKVQFGDLEQNTSNKTCTVTFKEDGHNGKSQVDFSGDGWGIKYSSNSQNTFSL